ncbi:MAG: MFS transporter [Halieaceae bacterium]|nr:MFS transporter [Halieaceae bacterium]
MSRLQKFGYSLGQFAWASKDVSFHYFLFFYYTQFQGLSPSLAGLAALLALVADGISDPIIGQVSDNWGRGRLGRRHPFMMLAILPYLVCLLAIFNPPDALAQGALFAWYLVFAILVRSFLTLFTVPHMALGAELADDYIERTRIATGRNIMGYIGGLLIQVAAWFVIIPAATSAGDAGDGYRQVGYMAAALALVGMLAAWFGTQGRIPYLRQISEDQQQRPWWHAFKDVLALFQVHSARIMLLGGFLLVLKVGLANTMLLHVNTFFWGLSSEQIGVFMLSVFLALFPAAWLATRGTAHYGKRNAMVTFVVAVALTHPLLVVAHLFGLTPPTGSLGLLMLVCLMVAINQSFSIAAINVTAAMLPDVADELELHTGRRQEGILNSGIMLSQKVMFGLGTFFAGLIIEYVGIAGITDIAEVTPEMFQRLGWVYGPGLSAISLAGAWVYTHYGLDRKRLETVQSQLQATRSSSGAIL